MLRECRKVGVVHSDINPSNVRVTASGLRLIDYGRDIQPYTELGFQHMARRVFLSWRWHHCYRLAELRRQSLWNEKLPELAGFECYFRALDNTSVPKLVWPLVEKMLSSARSLERVLDYGCGKGAFVARLAELAGTVTGYDPDSGLRVHWPPITEMLAGRVLLTPDRDAALSRGPFDAVVCLLVLCDIVDDSAYHRALRDLQSAVKEDGLVIVAVCNPLFTFGGPTYVHRKRAVPAEASYQETFVHDELVLDENVQRKDVHRPLSRLRSDFLSAGLQIVDVAMSESTDWDRAEPSSDFMVFALHPVPATSRSVSLVIRSCAMEWQTLETQVCHIVKQLEGPRPFHEKILIADCRAMGFLRQYMEADVDAYNQVLQRLLDRRVVDRLVREPQGEDDVAALYHRWFGVEATNTLAANGAQVASTLTGFEACTGEFILHVDADVMVARMDPCHDYLADMIRVLDDDEKAVTVSFNIAPPGRLSLHSRWHGRFMASGEPSGFASSREAILHQALSERVKTGPASASLAPNCG